MTKALGGDIINNRIKEIRKAKGLTGAEFGKKIGVSGSAISMWESGSRGIPESAILSICREFGVNEVWLRTGQGEPFLATDRAAELGALVRQRLVDSPPSLQTALVTALLRFDPQGPEWAIVERIYDSVAAELASRPPAPVGADAHIRPQSDPAVQPTDEVEPGEAAQNDENPREV